MYPLHKRKIWSMGATGDTFACAGAIGCSKVSQFEVIVVCLCIGKMASNSPFYLFIVNLLTDLFSFVL